MEGGRARSSLQTRLTELEEELENERSKVKQLEGELVTTAVVKEGMEKDAEKVLYMYMYKTYTHNIAHIHVYRCMYTSHVHLYTPCIVQNIIVAFIFIVTVYVHVCRSNSSTRGCQKL